MLGIILKIGRHDVLDLHGRVDLPAFLIDLEPIVLVVVGVQVEILIIIIAVALSVVVVVVSEQRLLARAQRCPQPAQRPRRAERDED